MSAPGDPNGLLAFCEPLAVTQGLAPTADGRVWYWDTGGSGSPVVFVHPNAGSGLSWFHQGPTFAKAGHRVVGYSRLNYFGSDCADRDMPGIASENLRALVDHLGLGRLHLVSVAAGGGVATDYALSYPQSLLSLTVCSRTAGIAKGPVADAVKALKPPQWSSLPRWFQEVGPSYRGGNPQGLERWIEINRLSEVRKSDGGRQRNRNLLTAEALAQLAMPTLLMTGDADLTAPPSVVRVVAGHIPGSELVIVPEAGHSIYWEQPEAFNRHVLDFIGRHDGR